MITSFKDFESFNITKIYKGKDNYCRCGCGGRYYYPENQSFNRILKNAEKMFNENLRLTKENPILSTLDRFTINVPIGTCEGYINIPVLDDVRPQLNQCYCIYLTKK